MDALIHLQVNYTFITSLTSSVRTKFTLVGYKRIDQNSACEMLMVVQKEQCVYFKY